MDDNTPAPSSPLAPGGAPAPLPEHRRLTELAAAHVVGALATYARRERITWDVTVDAMAGPVGPQPVVLVLLQTPSPLLGQSLGEVVVMDPAHAAEYREVDRAVAAAVERLLQARSRAAATRN